MLGRHTHFHRALAPAFALTLVSLRAGDAAAEDETAPFVLVLNDVEQGEVRLLFREKAVFARKEDLDGAGLQKYSASEITTPQGVFVALESIRPRVRYTVDEKQVVLRLWASPECLPKKTIDLESQAPPGTFKPETSGFLNYAPRLSFVPLTFNGYAEAGFTEGGERLYFTGVSYSNVTGITRGLSNIVWDDRAALRRITIGDASVRAGGTSSIVVGGLTIARSFSLNPYKQISPSFAFTGATETPSTLEVYVNGQRIRSEPVPPGTFALQNLYPALGGGNVTYVLRDAYGNEQRTSIPYYSSLDILKKGLTDYSVSVGFRRGPNGLSSFDYREFGTVAYYRVGLSDSFTAGVRVDATFDRGSVGISAARSSTIGKVDLDFTMGYGSGSIPGIGGSLGYSYVSRYFTANTQVRAYASNYSTWALPPGSIVPQFDASVSIFAPFSDRGGLSARYFATVLPNGTNGVNLSLTGNFEIAPDLTASLGVMQSCSSIQPPINRSVFELTGTLSWAFDRNWHVSAISSVRQVGGSQQTLSVNRLTPFGEGWGTGGSLTFAEVPQINAYHRVNASFGQLNTRFDWIGEAGSVSLEPAGSIVWVRRAGFFFTRPIYDGYGLVHAPGLKDVRVFASREFVGKTNAAGNLIVPGLIPFYGNSVAISEEDVPLNWRLDRFTESLAVPYRGVGVAEFKGDLVVVVHGLLMLVVKGERILPAYGEISVHKGNKTLLSPIAEDGFFELQDLPAGKQLATIQYKDFNCELTLDVPSTEGTTALAIELGDLVCTIP